MENKPEIGQAGVEVTPEMEKVGVYALQGFGSLEDFAATNPSLVVREVFSAMQRAKPKKVTPAAPY